MIVDGKGRYRETDDRVREYRERVRADRVEKIWTAVIGVGIVCLIIAVISAISFIAEMLTGASGL